MTQNKIKVALVFGGQSAEHEVSISSAKNIASAIDLTRFELLLLGISQSGIWYQVPPQVLPKLEKITPHFDKHGLEPITFIPQENNKTLVLNLKTHQSLPVDVVFPITHGTYGEDGTLQGFLKMCHVPFVGCDVLSSAVGMDKVIMKKLFLEAQLPTVRFLSFTTAEKHFIQFDKITHSLGCPFFVKPANTGSSVGVHKIKKISDFDAAVKDAFIYDQKILFEEAIEGREIECSILGNNGKTQASIPGEIKPLHDFYSYEAKYLDPQGAELNIPAELTPEMIRKVQELAQAAYHALCCDGFARVDFFLKPSGELLLNEINTLPGFTNISMYPKLWEHSGISYSQLITHLIELALEKYSQTCRTKTQF